MDIGISTACFFAESETEESLQTINGLNCNLCEAFLDCQSEYEPEFIEKIKAYAEREKMEIYSVHPMGVQFEGQLFSIGKRQRKDATDVFLKVLEAAKMLGSKIYVMHGPSTQNGIAKNINVDWLGAVIAELCETAKEYGVTIAWENVSWCVYNTPDFAARILEASKSDMLGFTFDIKQAGRSGFDPFEYLRYMGEKLVNVHLCDYIYSEGRSLARMPLCGEFDFLRLKNELGKINYGGKAFLEVYSDMYSSLDELKSSYESIKSLLG